MTDRFRLVPAAYVLLRRESAAADAAADGEGAGGRGEVLLQLRRGTGFMDGYWASAAAGHVEAGESVFAAACREAAEELGITVAPEDLVALTTLHRTQPPGTAVEQRVDFFFECRRWSGEPHLVEPDKAADLGWFPLDALPDPVVPHERWVLDRLDAGLPVVGAVGFADPAPDRRAS